MQYRNIVFLQGSEAIAIIDLLNESGSRKAMDELFEWDYGEGEITDYEPWGKADDLWSWIDGKHTYILSCNQNLDYISLTEVLE